MFAGSGATPSAAGRASLPSGLLMARWRHGRGAPVVSRVSFITSGSPLAAASTGGQLRPPVDAAGQQ